MVSEQDRAYMRRLGEAKASAHAEAASEHLRLAPIIERLRRSFAMSATMRTEANLAARVDPSGFYERARALGPCDP